MPHEGDSSGDTISSTGGCCKHCARFTIKVLQDAKQHLITELRTVADIETWFDGNHPIVVVTDADEGDCVCCYIKLSCAFMLRRYR
jgi:hypothetical protein